MDELMEDKKWNLFFKCYIILNFFLRLHGKFMKTAREFKSFAHFLMFFPGQNRIFGTQFPQQKKNHKIVKKDLPWNLNICCGWILPAFVALQVIYGHVLLTFCCLQWLEGKQVKQKYSRRTSRSSYFQI